jgi:putative DNA primase/helicase
MRLTQVATAWQENGVSVVPIIAKSQPAVRWKQYQAHCPTLDEIQDWWGNGHPWGIAIICGAVSGNLEMCELEARASDGASITKIQNAADTLGVGDIWDTLATGYTQQSPTGGIHLVYRISDHEVPGNEKIAREAPSLDPASGQMVRLVRAETRGEGGYFVGAPSPGSCHPSGEPWLLSSGEYGVVPSITWEQRQLVHEAIRIALDAPDTDLAQSHQSTPRIGLAPQLSIAGTIHEAAPDASASPGSRLSTTSGAASITPGDDWAARTDWADILGPAGWKLLSQEHTGERFWVRPGKERSDGHGASTDYQGKPGLYVWSTSAGLETETPLSKLFVYAHYNFNGDMSACAKYLYARNFGTRMNVAAPTEAELAADELDVTVARDKPPWFSLDDMGNGARMWHDVHETYRYSHEQRCIQHFDGSRWEPDHTGGLVREWDKITLEMIQEARRTGDEKLLKWAHKSRDLSRINAAIAVFKTMPQATIKTSDMDTRMDLINTHSGEYSILERTVQPHQADHFMTRITGASYKPEATAPKWTEFLEQVLPDEGVRKYVQRAVGYSLLGRADQRAFFIIHGPSGTGKSQFLSTLEYVFGSYATTAAEGTFASYRDSGGPTNDLHGLRGKRLVTTSETAEGSNFNEVLMKRLTGRDKITSRQLYQENIDWIPECAIWLATNYPPRFNSDDDAIWKRAKLVPFMTRFGTDAPEVSDYARKFLYAEADGILNWILEGLHDYLENGLGEPEAVKESAVTHREQSDSVIRFLDDMMADSVLVAASEGTIRTRELYQLYEEWSRGGGERKLGSRRFLNRVESSGRATYARVEAGSVWKGLHRNRVLPYVPQLGS